MTNYLSSEALLMLNGMLIAFASMGIVRIGMAIYGHIKFELTYRKFPRLVKYDELRACSGPHKWQPVALAVRNLPHGRYNVCMTCGSISGITTYMVSDTLLTQAKEALVIAQRKAELEQQVQARIAAVIDARVTDFIMKQFPKESNDPTFVGKLLELSELTLVTQNNAIEQVAAEMEIEKDFGGTFNWSRDARGNA